MNPLPNKKYKTILADPPWHEQGGGKIKRGADRHYELMKTKDIMALPVQDITEDNAHLYLTEIFVLDPNYNPARKMQQEIIDYYSEQAIVALESKRYALAVRNYENILKFTPGAPEIIEKLDNTLTLRDEEFAKYQLLIEQKKDSLESPMLASIDSISFNSLDIRQLVQDDSEPIGLENVQTAETQNQPAVNSGYSIPLEGTLTQKEPIIEALIDGGTRQYLHREKPVIPSWLRYDGIHKIRVECIVNTKGRVEMVSLMKPSTNKALNKLAINTFKRYKYKPATLRGIPVRFKVVEIIIFR